MSTSGIFQVRLHGRPGQGAATAAKLLAAAANEEGRHGQAFSRFGFGKRGGPVVYYCRLADRPIRTRAPVRTPDAVVLLDPALLRHEDPFDGLATEGYLLLDGGRSPAGLGLAHPLVRLPRERALAVPASEIAHRHLGRPLPNAALLGGFAALTGQLQLASVRTAIRRRFPGPPGGANALAAAECFYAVRHSIAMPA